MKAERIQDEAMTEEMLDALVDALHTVEADVKDALRRQYEVRKRIEELLEAMGSLERKGDGWAVTLKPEVIWHKELLSPLKEIVPQNVLADNGYFAEHMKLVPEYWNMTRIKALRKHSAEARRIINSAEEVGPSKLTVTFTKEEG